MSVSEDDQKSKEKKSKSSSWRMIPLILEKVVTTVDGVTNRFLSLVKENADAVIDRGIEKLLGLLALGTGTIFFLTGGAKFLDHILGIPGVGSMLVGIMVLFLVTLFILARRIGN